RGLRRNLNHSTRQRFTAIKRQDSLFVKLGPLQCGRPKSRVQLWQKDRFTLFSKLNSFQIRSSQIGFVKVSAKKNRAGKLSIPQISAFESRIHQVGSIEVRIS